MRHLSAHRERLDDALARYFYDVGMPGTALKIRGNNMTEGIDISHYQQGLQFHDVVAAGKQFVYIKATQGLSGVDPCFADFRARAHDTDLLVGPFHFFLPYVDAKAQAEHFFTVAQPQTGELIAMLDTETDAPNVADESMAFAMRIKELSGKLPWIYTSDSMFTERFTETFNIDWPRWLARYGHSPDNPCSMWQFSQSGRIGGINVDCDHFVGTLAELKTKYTY